MAMAISALSASPSRPHVHLTDTTNTDGNLHLAETGPALRHPSCFCTATDISRVRDASELLPDAGVFCTRGVSLRSTRLIPG